MPTVITSDEYLEFDADSPYPAVPMNTPAWKITDYTNLRRRVRVGEDRPIPGSPGRLYIPREFDELVCDLPLRIFGARDWQNNLYSDSWLGVDLNHSYLRDNVFDVLGERDVTFHTRHGSSWTGTMVVENWAPVVDPNSGGDVLGGTLTVAIPAGMLTETGS